MNAFFKGSETLSVKVSKSENYWLPKSISFFGELGQLDLQLPENEYGIYNLLEERNLGSFFRRKDRLIIGNDIKDLISFLRHYDIVSEARAIDLELLVKLDPDLDRSQHLSTDLHDLFYRIPWARERLSGPFGRIYKHLIEGVFAPLAMIENEGIYLEGNGKVHSRYNLAAISGRFSCTSGDGFFNPHSVPRTEEARGKYYPRDGYRLILSDEKAMEMRVLAQLSGDKNLIEVFNLDLDIYEIVARRVLRKNTKELVLPKERTLAKQIGFLMIFGGTAYGLARKAKISRNEASSLIRSFLKAFPSVEQWILETQIKCLEQGYISSVFGRIRKFDPSNGKESELRSMQNFCVQSAAADINCLILRGIYHLLPKNSRIALHLHDGAVLVSPPDEVEETCRIVKLCSENPPGLSLFNIKLEIPLKVKIKVTDRWE